MKFVLQLVERRSPGSPALAIARAVPWNWACAMASGVGWSCQNKANLFRSRAALMPPWQCIWKQVTFGQGHGWKRRVLGEDVMHREGLGGKEPGGGCTSVCQAVLCADPGQRLGGTGWRDSLLCLVSLVGFMLGEWSSVTRDSQSPWHLVCAQKGDNRPSSESTKVVFTCLWA